MFIQPRQPLLAPEMATELSNPAPTDSFDIKAHAQISDELQRLITELDFAGTVAAVVALVINSTTDQTEGQPT